MENNSKFIFDIFNFIGYERQDQEGSTYFLSKTNQLYLCNESLIIQQDEGSSMIPYKHIARVNSKNKLVLELAVKDHLYKFDFNSEAERDNSFKILSQSLRQCKSYEKSLNLLEVRRNQLIALYSPLKSIQSCESLFVANLSVQDLYILFFSQNEYSHYGVKSYKCFIQFYLKELCNFHSIQCKEMDPQPPEYFSQYCSQDRKSLLRAPVSSEAKYKATRINQILSYKCQLTQRTFWVANDYLLILFKIRLQKIIKCKVVVELVESKEGVKINTFIQQHVKQQTYLDSEIKKRLNELRNLIINIAKYHNQNTKPNTKPKVNQQSPAPRYRRLSCHDPYKNLQPIDPYIMRDSLSGQSESPPIQAQPQRLSISSMNQDVECCNFLSTTNFEQANVQSASTSHESPCCRAQSKQVAQSFRRSSWEIISQCD